jgi:hypothetical protein
MRCYTSEHMAVKLMERLVDDYQSFGSCRIHFKLCDNRHAPQN